MPQHPNLDAWLRQLRERAGADGGPAPRAPTRPATPPPASSPTLGPASAPPKTASMWEDLFGLPPGTLGRGTPAAGERGAADDDIDYLDDDEPETIAAPPPRPPPAAVPPPPPATPVYAPPPAAMAGLRAPAATAPAISAAQTPTARKRRPPSAPTKSRSTLALSRDLFADLRLRPAALREAVLLLGALGPCLADRDPAERFF